MKLTNFVCKFKQFTYWTSVRLIDRALCLPESAKLSERLSDFLNETFRRPLKNVRYPCDPIGCYLHDGGNFSIAIFAGRIMLARFGYQIRVTKEMETGLKRLSCSSLNERIRTVNCRIRPAGNSQHLVPSTTLWVQFDWTPLSFVEILMDFFWINTVHSTASIRQRLCF